MTSRYIFIDSDSANSSLVWREVLNGDLQFYKNWRPTVDNWYFSIYPLHFLLFLLLNNDGLIPIVLATAIFTFSVAVCSAKISDILFGKKAFYFTLIALTVLCFPMYRWGFVQHPFSHNSTNAFGFLCLLISIANYKKGSLICIITVALLSVAACISDPWFAPTFFLPIIISEIFRVFENENNAKFSFVIYTLSFIVVMSHVIQRLMDIPVHHFQIVSFERIMLNFAQMPLTIGRSVNFLIVDKPAAYVISLMIFLIFSVMALAKMVKMRNIYIYSAALMTLSFMGIISSFILSNKADGYITMRFFVNLQPLFYILASCVISYYWISAYVASTLIILVGNSLSYVNSKPTTEVELTRHKNYANFLISNGLKIGVGPYWKYSMGINWLYPQQLHISPVTFNDDGSINKKIIRAQTMKSWMKDNIKKSKTSINFIVLKKGENKGNGECPDIDLCSRKLSDIYGEPKKILKYEDLTILAFDKYISL